VTWWMNLTEIKHMIANLVNYRDSDITHTLANRFKAAKKAHFLTNMSFFAGVYLF
jgi:hypothetical protein